MLDAFASASAFALSLSSSLFFKESLQFELLEATSVVVSSFKESLQLEVLEMGSGFFSSFRESLQFEVVVSSEDFFRSSSLLLSESLQLEVLETESMISAFAFSLSSFLS